MISRNTPAHVVARWITLAVGAVCSVAGWVAAGSPGLTGGLIATVLVVAFFSTSLVPVLIARGSPASASAGAAVLLLTYMLRVAVAVATFTFVSRADFADSRWVGATIIVTAMTWVSVHAWSAIHRSKTEPTIVPEASAGGRGE